MIVDCRWVLDRDGHWYVRVFGPGLPPEGERLDTGETDLAVAMAESARAIAWVVRLLDARRDAA